MTRETLIEAIIKIASVQAVLSAPPARYTFFKDPVVSFWKIYNEDILCGVMYTRKHEGKLFFSIELNKNKRGKGIGTGAVKKFLQTLKPGKTVYATTRKSNLPMNNIFTRLGWLDITGSNKQKLYKYRA